MIFKTKTLAERMAWHRWFAWRPVSWDGGWAWLSIVERAERQIDGVVCPIHIWLYRKVGGK